MNPDRRIIVYPQYIDANKTVAEGRRIPKSLACDDPFTNEVFDCCKLLNLEAAIEAKHYPRDWLPKGRVRVQLKKEDGAPFNPEIPDRRTLLIKLAELVPKHPGRAGGKGRHPTTATKLAEQAGGSAGPSGASASTAAAAKAGAAKKGKKGKK